jgi:A/G-specific adenine glycosylase
MRRSSTTKKLLRWFDENRRDLPWRAPRGADADPYAVWLSEIMLQQTTVASVTGFFHKFISRWPDVSSLAQAPIEDVLAAWAGLGYYARARNLHACANIVATQHGGRFPRREDALLQLPGVGPYTAAAISAIAFREPCVAVDGNVERVISRFFALAEPPPGAKRKIKALAGELLSKERPGDFLQALMDLGAMVCTPRSPACAACPLSEDCTAKRLGQARDFPVKPPKPERPRRRGAAFVLRSGDFVLLRRRPDKGLYGGMTEFPATPFDADHAEKEAMLGFAPARAPWRELKGPVRHIFSHFSLELKVFVAETPKPQPIAGCRWVKASGLADEALPTLMRKAALHAGLARSKPSED